MSAKSIELSIDKWQKARNNIVKQDSRICYRDEYWQPCGYCREFPDCTKCPLQSRSRSRKYYVPYCFPFLTIRSVVSTVLRQAETGYWKQALEYVDILLAKMKRDLKKAEQTKG